VIDTELLGRFCERLLTSVYRQSGHVEGAVEEKPRNCHDKFFRCEFYWAHDTDDAKNVEKTYYCTYFVCKGMSVKVSILPETCSGYNRVGIAKADHDIYYSYPLAYSCTNTACGACSTAQITMSDDLTIAFLLGCNGEHSCYGQAEVSIVVAPSPTQLLTPPISITKKLQATQYIQGSPSPKYRGGPLNQGRFSNSVANLDLVWKFKTYLGMTIISPLDGIVFIVPLISLGFKSSVTIGQNNMIYVGSDDNNIYAFAPDGEVKWTFGTEGKIMSTPAISSNNTLYVGSEDLHLYAIDAKTGNFQWKIMTRGKIYTSPVIGNSYDVDAYLSISLSDSMKGVGGNVYIADQDGYLYCITSQGKIRYVFSTFTGNAILIKEKDVHDLNSYRLGGIFSSPALLQIDNTIYFGSENSYFYAIHGNSGKLRFKFKTGSGVFSSAAFSSDGSVVYFGSDDYYLYAITTSSGTLKFRFKAVGHVRSAPAIDNEGMILLLNSHVDCCN
jgi:outer membrane protein assembly factor BamB